MFPSARAGKLESLGVSRDTGAHRDHTAKSQPLPTVPAEKRQGSKKTVRRTTACKSSGEHFSLPSHSVLSWRVPEEQPPSTKLEIVAPGLHTGANPRRTGIDPYPLPPSSHTYLRASTKNQQGWGEFKSPVTAPPPPFHVKFLYMSECVTLFGNKVFIQVFRLKWDP